MKITRNLLRLAAAVLLLAAMGAFPAFGQTFAVSGTTTLGVTVGPEAAIAIPVPATTLATTGTLFADYIGSTGFTYKIRTTQSSGQGHINLKITTDFSGSGGPKVAAPPTAGDALTYTCSSASSGTPCSSAQTASTTADTTVVSFGADAHSTKAGDSGTVSWNLTNDPVYQTGTYSAVATLTISVL